MGNRSRLIKIGYAAAGVLLGAAIFGGLSAQAATSSSTTAAPTAGSTTNSATASTDPHPGDNGADGIPEAQEPHGGPGGALPLNGTVTAVGPDSVTIKTTSATTTYTVTSSSDIDKNGEATLSNLVAGDAVRFSVAPSNNKQIDKLHAGNEAQDAPHPPSGSGTNG